MLIPKEDFPKYTPVMQQYLNARHGLIGKTVLFFRMGDFYETFFDDAEIAARELEITLTGRPESNYPGGRIPMAGVPAKTIQPYVAKLLEKGYKVCIAEQMADPSTVKGLVPREITKVYTPGTIDDLDLLPSFQNNFIAAIFPGKTSKTQNSTGAQSSAETRRYGLAFTDISTGEFYLTELCERGLKSELGRIQASEILIPSQKGKREEGEIEAKELAIFELPEEIKNLVKDSYISLFDKRNFDLKNAKEKLLKKFTVQSLASFGISEEGSDGKNLEPAIQAAGSILEYLEAGSKSSNHKFEALRIYNIEKYMVLDAQSRRNLELSSSSSFTRKSSIDGSLLWSIDRTNSNAGKRRLKAWIEQPLRDIKAIEARQESVEELINDYSLMRELSDLLSKTYDTERLSNRLANESANPRELNMLKESLLKILEISKLVQNSKSTYPSRLKAVPDELLNTISQIESAIRETPPISITEGEIIREGYNEELDEYLSLVNDSKTWLENYQKEEVEKSKIKNLKVKFNKVHGYFIEISKGNLGLVPENYSCKQTMVNSSRFITEELKDFEEKFTNAESRRNGLEHSLFTGIRKMLSVNAEVLLKIANYVAELDAILSLAKIAQEQNYSKPQIVSEKKVLELKDSRHPVIEQKLGLGEFTPNNIHLSGDGEEIIILTGPNMAGKSTYMRQVALNIILAQIGSFIPCSEAKLSLFDRIFTRVGASDDLASGQSTFMVEMNEVAAILNNMSEESFVILDEVGRGTSTYDGVSIAWAVVEHMAKTLSPLTIFATHYHELADLESLYPNVVNYQMLVSESLPCKSSFAMDSSSDSKAHSEQTQRSLAELNKASSTGINTASRRNSPSKIEFLHKVGPGSADKSYGIEVAKLAGLPKTVLNRARNINSLLQTRDTALVKAKDKAAKSIRKAINEDGEVQLEKLPLFAAQ